MTWRSHERTVPFVTSLILRIVRFRAHFFHVKLNLLSRNRTFVLKLQKKNVANGVWCTEQSWKCLKSVMEVDPCFFVSSSVSPLLCSSNRPKCFFHLCCTNSFWQCDSFFPVLCRASCCLYVPLTAGAAAVILLFPEQMCKSGRRRKKIGKQNAKLRGPSFLRCVCPLSFSPSHVRMHFPRPSCGPSGIERTS